jgi:hypothetical protein
MPLADYYHVYIKTNDGRETYKIDLTKEELIHTIADPINNERRFICDKTVILPGTITNIVVKKVDQPSKLDKKLKASWIIDNIAAAYGGNDDTIHQPKEFYLLKTGVDVTNDFITFQKSKTPKLKQPVEEEKVDAFAYISLVLTRFPLLARKLKVRHDDRCPFIINDEYDLQDLLWALLSLRFDDIRKEDAVPSFAGKSSRIDFVLKEERIVIETKLASEKLTDKEISKQLIDDIARYRKHPDCKLLVCFIYDPDRIILNGKGLIKDLESLSSQDLKVRVFVV